MKIETSPVHIKAFAEYLWHRFQFQPGCVLCWALEQPETKNNREALTAWVKQSVSAYNGRLDEDFIREAERALLNQLNSAGLVNDSFELSPIPKASYAHFWCMERFEKAAYPVG